MKNFALHFVRLNLFVMWERRQQNDEVGYETYLNQFLIGKVCFWVWMSVDCWGNAHVSLSSGVKRKYKFTFEDKGIKNPGLGLKPLLQIRQKVLEFPEYYKQRLRRPLRSISVGAADSRRRRIYRRALEPYGFQEIRTKQYGVILYKKF